MREAASGFSAQKCHRLPLRRRVVAARRARRRVPGPPRPPSRSQPSTVVASAPSARTRAPRCRNRRPVPHCRRGSTWTAPMKFAPPSAPRRVPLRPGLLEDTRASLVTALPCPSPCLVSLGKKICRCAVDTPVHLAHERRHPPLYNHPRPPLLTPHHPVPLSLAPISPCSARRADIAAPRPPSRSDTAAALLYPILPSLPRSMVPQLHHPHPPLFPSGSCTGTP